MRKSFKNIFYLFFLALSLGGSFAYAYKFCVINNVQKSYLGTSHLHFYPVNINVDISIQRSAGKAWDLQGTVINISNIVGISNQGCIEISPAPFTNLAAFTSKEQQLISTIKFDVTPSLSMYGLESASCEGSYPQENNPPEDVQAIVTESSGKLACQVVINKL